MATNPKQMLSAVKSTDDQLETIAGGGSITSGDDTFTADEATLYLTSDTSVSFKAQNLTTEQKTQARTNIGAGESTVSVSNSGTATDEVSYITINGVEKKLAGGSGGGSVGLIPFFSITGSSETFTYSDGGTTETLQILVFDLNNTNWAKLVDSTYVQFNLSYSPSSNEDVYSDFDLFLITHNYSSSWTATELFDNSLQMVTNGNGSDIFTDTAELKAFRSTTSTSSTESWCFSGTCKDISGGQNPIKGFYVTSMNLDNKQDAITIKTTMDSTAQPNTEYYLGTQSTVSVTLPSTAEAGQTISVDFASGSTATTLTITGSNLAGDTTYTPEANKLIELNFKYDGTYWKLLVSSIDIPSGV